MEYMSALENGLDEQKPSLFEILAEQQLSGLIPPSLRYLLAIAAHRHPRYLLRVLNSFDELYAVLSLIVERYYLRNYGGGFTENFYGLKRERVLRIKGGEVPRTQLGAPSEVRDVLKLRNNDVWKNLGMMVLLPYLKRKLDESYDIHAASVNLLGPSYRDREAYPQDGTIRQRIMWLYKWFLRKAYPSVNAAYYFSILAFNLAYLFDGSKYDSPFLWLIGTRMRRLNDADRRAIASLTNPKAVAPKPGNAPGRSTSIFHPRTLTAAVYSGSLSSLRILLPTSIFALKFLEWWHASDFARQLTKKANEGLELPPPIIAGASPSGTSSQSTNDEKTGSRRASGIANPPISSLTHLPILTVPLPLAASTEAQDGDDDAAKHCPICLGEIQTATAAQTGYVYCYTCIYKWVDGTHPRQETFMEGSGDDVACSWAEESGGSRVGKWDSGAGRDAVTGRRVLGGTSGLRRVMI